MGEPFQAVLGEAVPQRCCPEPTHKPFQSPQDGTSYLCDSARDGVWPWVCGMRLRLGWDGHCLMRIKHIRETQTSATSPVCSSGGGDWGSKPKGGQKDRGGLLLWIISSNRDKKPNLLWKAQRLEPGLYSSRHSQGVWGIITSSPFDI